MVVRRNFEELYRTQEDPWQIGEADSLRYQTYLELLQRHSPAGGFGRALDLGCGKGAFTARLASVAREVVGVELSEIAVAKAKAFHPTLQFVRGDARRLADLDLPGERFDLIVCSDLIAYFTPREAAGLLREMARRLAPDGRLFLAAWSPGGRYYTPDQLEALAGRHFALLAARTLASGHACFVGRHRRRDLVLTFDYETWQPIPPGRRIDWEATVLRPTAALMEIAERHSVPLTFFVEMGEILFLRGHDPAAAAALENQIREIRRRGHDVQLHLHPEWLPESGVRHDPARDTWEWNAERNRLVLLDQPPEQVLDRVKRELEAIVRPADPGYRVRVFRAGKYRIQPSRASLEALRSIGIEADSSVWAGGHSAKDRFDFRGAWSTGTPYYPSSGDINLPAPVAEESILEFPILSLGKGRFTLDGAGAETLRARVAEPRRRDFLARLKEDYPTAWRRIASRLRRLPGSERWPRLIREPVPAYNLEGDDTLVAIGHTKADLDLAGIEGFLSEHARLSDLRFRRFAEAVEDRLAEREARRATPREVFEAQVERETGAVLGEERNTEQSAHLQRMIPLDRGRILDLGCGAGYWTRHLAARHGFCVGTDYGMAFLSKARDVHQVPVVRSDFHRLPFPSGAFDTVYADNVLEHSPDPGALLSEIHRVLDRRGLLAAAVPPDARNPRYPVSDHLWKTDRRDLEERVHAAGFTRIAVEEVDTVRAFGMAPYPAAANAMLYLTAWRGDGEEYTDRRRLEDLMEFVYRRLDPSRSQDTLDPEAILRGGHAWCLGYCAVLAELLRREGIRSRFVTLEARNHPRGRGPEGADTHELVEADLSGRWVAVDPMANRVLEYSVEELIARPDRADRAAASRLADRRFRERAYHLYCSSFFYQRVVRFCRRVSLTDGEPWHWIPVRRPSPEPGGAGVSTLRILLTDPTENQPAPETGPIAEGVSTWTRGDLAASSAWRTIRRIRKAPQRRLEILSEDLDWHERIVRLHLLGAAARSGSRILRDRRGREEPLGILPFLTRQGPEFLSGLLRAQAALVRMRAALGLLARASRRSPRRLPARRPASVLYLKSDLWRGLKAGGSVGHVAGMAEAFQRAGHRVRFLAAEAPAQIDTDRMPLTRVPPPVVLRVSRAAGRFAHTFALLRAGSEAYASNPPGMLYHRFDEGSLAGVLLSRSLGVPLVLEYNGSGVWIADHWDRPLPHRPLFEAIERANLEHAHLIVAVSRVLRDELVSKGVEPDRVLLCPNGVDADRYHPAVDGAGVRRQLELEGRTVIGFIGTFGPWHGAPVLARAAGEVAERHPQAEFLFVGDGPQLPETREILRRRGIEARCRFTGLVPQSAAPQYLAACDLLVSPHVPNPDGSRFFGSPTKLFEYMAMGRGIVASRLEQIAEVLEDGRTALLVPPGDPAPLAEAISRLVSDSSLRRSLGEAARIRAVERHTWDSVAGRVLDAVRFL